MVCGWVSEKPFPLTHTIADLTMALSSLKSGFIFLLFLVFSGMKISVNSCSFDWLRGTWVNNSLANPVYEKWYKEDGILLSGISFKISKGDTLVSEMMKLTEKEGDYYFVPTVKDQNNSQPVLFKIDSCLDGYFRARNDSHDFPQVIIYKRISVDSLEAEISGNINGKSKSIIFPMKKAAK